MNKKLFIVPNNDAEALAIQKLLKDNKQDFLVTKQGRGATWEGLEEGIKDTLKDLLDTEIIGVDLGGKPLKENYKNYNNTQHSEENNPNKRISVINKIGEDLGLELSIKDKFVAANNIGYIPKMVELGKELGLREEEINNLIKKINNMENEAQGVTQETIKMAEEAIEEGYIYDGRLIWIDLDDFKGMRQVTNILYEMNKNKNLGHKTTVVNTKDNGLRMVVFTNQKLIGELSDMYPENSRKGGGEEQGFWGIQFKDKSEKLSFEKELRYYLEEETLGYHRIIEREDILKTRNYGNNLNMHEINDAMAFHKCISTAKKGNDFGAFVHAYKPKYYKDMKLFVVNAGAAGMALKNDGDIVSVFKNPDMAEKDMIAKINHVLMLTAIQNGGKKLDCFDGFLPGLYAIYGFQPVAKQKFNKEFAPEGRNFERDGTPDIIFMSHNGLSYEEILKRYAENDYLPYDAYYAPYTEDRDEALELQKKNINNSEKINQILTKEQKDIIKNTTLLLPPNDGEAKLIREIASKLGFEVKEVKQNRGGNLLEKGLKDDPDLLNSLKENVWIIEMPSEDIEKELSEKHNLKMIDHHFYNYSDRTNKKSSIEQFIESLGLDEEQIKEIGYDPRFIKGVGINDKDYIYGLVDAGYSIDEIKSVRDFDIRSQIGGKYKKMKKRNVEIYNAREEQKGIVIIHSKDGDNTSIASDMVILQETDIKIKKVLDIRKNESGQITFMTLSGEVEWIKDIKQNTNPTFGGNGLGKYSDFIGRVNPNESILNKIHENLNIKF